MIATLTRNAVEADEEMEFDYYILNPRAVEAEALEVADYLYADDTIPTAEEIEEAFEDDEEEYPCCRCPGCFYCT